MEPPKKIARVVAAAAAEAGTAGHLPSGAVEGVAAKHEKMVAMLCQLERFVGHQWNSDCVTGLSSMDRSVGAAKCSNSPNGEPLFHVPNAAEELSRISLQRIDGLVLAGKEGTEEVAALLREPLYEAGMWLQCLSGGGCIEKSAFRVRGPASHTSPEPRHPVEDIVGYQPLIVVEVVVDAGYLESLCKHDGTRMVVREPLGKLGQTIVVPSTE